MDSNCGLIRPQAGLELTAWGSSTPRPLFKTVVELHVEVEAQAIIHVETTTPVDVVSSRWDHCEP